MKKNGKVKVGGNAVTSGGSLPCNFLIHAVGPYFEDVRCIIKVTKADGGQCFNR